MSQEKVVPIGRGAMLRARVSFPTDDPSGAFNELARETVGERTFIAERGRVRGKSIWRIRIEGTPEVIDYSDPMTQRAAFAALAGTEPDLLDAWLCGRANAT